MEFKFSFDFKLNVKNEIDFRNRDLSQRELDLDGPSKKSNRLAFRNIRQFAISFVNKLFI